MSNTKTAETIVEKRERTVRDLLIRHGFGRLSFDQGIKEIDKLLSRRKKPND